jgi:hypothetical protein
MTYYANPPQIVSHDLYEVVVLDGNNNRIRFQFDYFFDVDKLKWLIRKKMYSNAWAMLRKAPRIIEDINPWQSSYEGAHTGRFSSLIPPGAYKFKIEEVTECDSGIRVKFANNTEKEMLMSKYDTKTEPDKTYRYTAIAVSARSLTYHGQRQWFKSAADCERFCKDVFEAEHPKKFQLAIVEAKDLIEPKQTIQTTKTRISK